MVGIAGGQHATEADLRFTESVFASSANILRIDESKMNAITAVSGSGPAYIFRFLEVMLDAAQSVGGFSPQDAELLVSQTAQGAMAYLDAQEGFPVARLRQEVTSPGGTTEAALRVFQSGALDALVSDAVRAAIVRGAELDSETV